MPLCGYFLQTAQETLSLCSTLRSHSRSLPPPFIYHCRLLKCSFHSNTRRDHGTSLLSTFVGGCNCLRLTTPLSPLYWLPFSRLLLVAPFFFCGGSSQNVIFSWVGVTGPVCS
uniref:Uncharacterized protein n=1 Tax=Leishmania guyanensis TaxID=5670 RepID=A0A1E1J1Z7_LEIGU|nr:Hypothetical protein BN36_3051060 [Leishmania guyanensis]